MFSLFVDVADTCWDKVDRWNWFQKWTVGRQLVRAADSVGANIAEGAGRYRLGDSIHFFVIARSSARETQYWLKRCAKRRLMPARDVDLLLERLARGARLLNALITYRRQHGPNEVREERAGYQAEAAIYKDSSLDTEVWNDSGLAEDDERAWLQDSTLNTEHSAKTQESLTENAVGVMEETH